MNPLQVHLLAQKLRMLFDSICINPTTTDDYADLQSLYALIQQHPKAEQFFGALPSIFGDSVDFDKLDKSTLSGKELVYLSGAQARVDSKDFLDKLLAESKLLLDKFLKEKEAEVKYKVESKAKAKK